MVMTDQNNYIEQYLDTSSAVLKSPFWGYPYLTPVLFVASQLNKRSVFPVAIYLYVEQRIPLFSNFKNKFSFFLLVLMVYSILPCLYIYIYI